MSVYRITSFTAPAMDKAAEFSETLRDAIEGTHAEFIDIVDYGDGKGVVVAKYADHAAMETATAIAQNVFGQMVEAGVIDGGSIQPQSGKVLKSF